MKIEKCSVCQSCVYKAETLFQQELIENPDVLVVLDRPRLCKHSGLPLVDKELKKIIADAGLKTSSVCYTYAAMCAGNANVDKAANVCSRLYLARMVQTLKPKVVLCCGSTAASFFTRNQAVLMGRQLLGRDVYANADIFYTVDIDDIFKKPASRTKLVADVSKAYRHLQPKQESNACGLFVIDNETFKEFCNFCNEIVGEVVVSIETNGQPATSPTSRLTHIGFCKPSDNVGYSLLLDVLRKDPALIDEAMVRVAAILKDNGIRKIMHGTNKDAVFLMCKRFEVNNVCDTEIEQFLLCETKDTYDLQKISEEKYGLHCDNTKKDAQSIGAQNIQNVTTISKLHVDFTCGSTDKVKLLYNDIICGSLPVLNEMMHTGMLFDRARHCVAEKEARADYANKVRALTDAYPCFRGVNLSSTEHVARVLETQLCVPMIKQSKKTDAVSLDKGALLTYALRMSMPWARMLLDIRKADKLISSYLSTLPKFVAQDGRIHPTINSTSTVTGRLSVTDPAMQTFTRGSSIHSLFVAGKGKRFVHYDLSQIELRVGGSIADEPRILAAYNNNEDIHRITASTVYEIGIDEVVDEQRQLAKPINFALFYGQTDVGLKNYLFESVEVDMQIEQVRAFRGNYFKLYAGLEPWYDRVREELLRTGKVTYPTGRVRRFQHVLARKHVDDATFRQAVNAPVQGSGNDISLYAMGRLYKLLRKRGLQDHVKFVMTTHDSCDMVMDDSDELMMDVCSMSAAILQNIQKHELFSWLKVPIIAEFKYGYDWGNMQKIKVAGMV